MNDTKNITKTEEKNIENLRRLAVVAPPVDIFENEDELLLVTDLPGVDTKNLNVSLDSDVLMLEGRRELEPEICRSRTEFCSIEYKRSFTMPRGIDQDKIKADLKNGVLRLHLPKAAELKPRQIAISGD